MAQYDALNALGFSLSSITKPIGHAAGQFASLAARAARGAGDLACQAIARDEVIEGAAVVNPIAGAGASAARGLCPTKKKPAEKPTKPDRVAAATSSNLPPWAIPAAVGGGILLLIMLRK